MTGDPPNGAGFIDIVDLDLPGGPSAPGQARLEIRHATEAVLAGDDSATATLLTSELVTNSVIHPQQPDDTSIALRIIRAQDRLRVEVTDSGSGFDPATRAQQEPESGGRGLLLVARLSDRWAQRTKRANNGKDSVSGSNSDTDPVTPAESPPTHDDS